MRASSKGGAPFNVVALAASGSSQSDAATGPLGAAPTVLVVSGGDDIVGVRLPPASKGACRIVKNLGTGGISGTLNVYPASGDAINALSTNSPLVMGSLKAATFIAFDSTTWYTVPLLPS